MTSEDLMKKDQLRFDGKLLDVRYHENGDDIVLDTVKISGTNQAYEMHRNFKEALKDKISGRF